MNKSDKTRVNVYLPVGVVEEIDRYRETLGLSRSAAVLSLAMTTLNQQKSVSAIEEFLKLAQISGKLESIGEGVDKA